MDNKLIQNCANARRCWTDWGKILRSGLRLALCFLVIALVAADPLHAATSRDGSIIVRIPDGFESHCINANTDTISLHLRRVIIQKDVGWFSEDKEVGLLLETTIYGMSNNTDQQRTFPRMFKSSVAEYDQGIVSLPIEQRLLHQFKLKRDKDIYNGIDLSFTVLKKKQKTNFGVALEQLVVITRQLPLPPNPYSQAFQFFSDYANRVVSESLNKDNNVDDQLKEGQFSLAFSVGGNCAGDFERTGTLAVVKASEGSEDAGNIDINKDYCWQAELKPVFELRFAKKPADGNCTNAIGFRKVRNSYYGFFLNAVEVGRAGLLAIPSDRLESVARCSAHGISPEDCL